MDRVEEIEKIFHTLSFFVIIHVQRDKSQTGQGLPQETKTACDGFFQRIPVENIKDDDQQNASPVIVCLKKPSRKESCGSRKERQERVEQTGAFHPPYGEEAEKQGKHHVLIGKFQEAAAESKVKRNFRDQGKEKKAKSVFLFVRGMEKSFHQQKTEDRKGQPSDPPEYLIDLRTEKAGRIGKSGRQLLVIGTDHSLFQDHRSNVIDEHNDKSRQFQSTAGKHWREKAFSPVNGFIRKHRDPFRSFPYKFWKVL